MRLSTAIKVYAGLFLAYGFVELVDHLRFLPRELRSWMVAPIVWWPLTLLGATTFLSFVALGARGHAGEAANKERSGTA